MLTWVGMKREAGGEEFLSMHTIVQPLHPQMESCLGDEYVYTPAREIERRVDRESRGVPTVGTTLVGFTPDQARTLAVKALTSGVDCAWKTVTARRM